MSDIFKTFVTTLKSRTTKQTNAELYKLMSDNTENTKLYKKYKDQLIINNVRLVVQKTTEYMKSSKLMIFDDLVQEGILGLTKSIDTYNPTLKYNFSTWASIHIKKYVLRFLDSQYMPKPHTQITENIDRVRKITNKLYYKLENKPTPEDVKKELDRLMKLKSKKNKKINKERLKKSLSPLSEQIGVDKNGKFIGININTVKYIMGTINNNCIMHSINLEQKGSLNDSSLTNDVNGEHYYKDIQENLIGNVLYRNMYENVMSLIEKLPLKHAEIVDMLLGISYERPFTLKEIQITMYNYFDDKDNYNNSIPRISRIAKDCFNKFKELK